MKVMRVRKSCRGEKILAIPKELAEKVLVSYMDVRLDEEGNLIYTPVPEIA